MPPAARRSRVRRRSRPRPARRASVLALLAILLAGRGAGQDGRPDAGYDAALRWEGERHGTLGPTGQRAFALRIDPAPGCRGAFACGDATLVLRDPIRLEIVRDGAPVALAPVRTTWFPSHLEAAWEDGGLRLVERKLVTDYDAIADELQLENLGSEPLDLELHVHGGATPERERLSSRQVAVDLSRAAVIAPVTGTPLFTSRPPPRAVWTECERPLAGTTGASVAADRDASGQAALVGFGARADERLDYGVIAPPLERPTLLLRFVNEASAPVSIRVEIDGRASGLVVVPPSDGSKGWRLARARLTDLRPGRVRLTLAAPSTATRLRLDGFFLAEEEETPGPLPASGVFAGTVPEQLDLPSGGIVLDGVHYALPEPTADTRPSVVALRGGITGDSAASFPERAAIELPDERPAIVTLHLLLATATPRGVAQGDAPAKVTLRLDDGSAETLDWPVAGAAMSVSAAPGASAPVPVALPENLRERVECRALRLAGLDAPALQVSYAPPPGRFLRTLELSAGGGPAVPLLLAATLEVPRETGRLPVLIGEASLADSPVHVALALTGAAAGWTSTFERGLTARIHLAPGASARFRAMAVVGSERLPVVLQALDLVQDEGLVPRHVADFERWFVEHVPAFTCSDPWLERAWRERWYVVRRNLLRLDLPDFSLPVAYAGTCCAEHARIAPGAASFALRELRWLRDAPAAQGLVRALLRRQLPSGLLTPVSPHTRGAVEAHQVAAGALGVYAATGSTQFLKEVLGLLERDFDATLQALDPDGDGLCVAPDAGYTGMPGRPLFWLVEQGSRVEPVDLACHVFAAARALAEGHRVLGEQDPARRLEALADRARTSVLGRCWVAEDAWFESLRAGGRPVRCREIAGVLPFSTGLAPPAPPYLAALDALASVTGFGGPFPVRSVARNDAADLRVASGSSADPRAWNGPVRPEAETWALDALALALRQGAGDAALFARILDTYTRLHFERGDLGRVVLREAYDPENGAGAGCPDVLRSAYADLLIQYVAGLVPRTDGVLEIRPIVRHLERFRFERIPYRGHLVDVTWDRPDGRVAYEARGVPEGFTVEVDGARVHSSATLEPFVLALAPGVAPAKVVRSEGPDLPSAPGAAASVRTDGAVEIRAQRPPPRLW